MSLMHRYKAKEKETLPRLYKCETLHKYHGNYIFVMIFNQTVVYQLGIKLMNSNVIILSMYHHNLEKLKFLPIFIPLHSNIMLNHAEKLTQYIRTCDTDCNTANTETSLSINKNLINVLNAVNYYTCDSGIYPHTLNPTPKEPHSSEL
jgi:hypothetical protein